MCKGLETLSPGEEGHEGVGGAGAPDGGRGIATMVGGSEEKAGALGGDASALIGEASIPPGGGWSNDMISGPAALFALSISGSGSPAAHMALSSMQSLWAEYLPLYHCPGSDLHHS